jgi:hypothetical protein
MKSQILITTCVVAILAGCSKQPAAQQFSTVPDAELVSVLEFIKSRDFDGAVRLGKTVFEPGLHIPNHADKLKTFIAISSSPGILKYELTVLQDDGSGGVINLYVMKDTGEIIQFVPWEFPQSVPKG